MLRILVLVFLLKPAIAVAQVRVVTYNIQLLLLQEIARVTKDEAASIADVLNAMYGSDVYAYGTALGEVEGSMRQGVVYRSDVLKLLGEAGIGVADKEGQPRQAMRYEFELLGFEKTFYV